MKSILFFLFLSAGCGLFAQSTSNEFQEIAQQIERLLQYRDKSPNELQSLLTKLERISAGNELMFKQIKLQVDHYILPMELKSIRSNIYNKNFAEASRALSNVKKKYAFTKEISEVEKSLNSALYKHYKRMVLQDINTRLSIEPSYTWYSELYSVSGIEEFDFVNFSPHLSLSANYLFHHKQYSNSGTNNTSYNQIGLRFEWRDENRIYLPLDPQISSLPSKNIQLTSIWGKFIGLDFGAYERTGNEPIIYNGTLSFYIPIGPLSFGIHGRGLTDLSSDPKLQLGASARIIYDFYKPFRSKHREEIEMRIFRFKESN